MSENRTKITDEQLSIEVIASVLEDLARRWLLILCVVLMMGMGAFVFSHVRYRPMYRSTATLVVSTSSTSATTYQNLNAASNLASVFTELINSSLFKAEVLEACGMSSFDGTISASIIAETNLLTLSVQGYDPREVFLMCRGILEHHESVTSQVLGNIVLEVLQDPLVPSSATNPLNVQSNVKKAMAAAFAGMIGLISLLSLMSDKVRSRHEADTKLNARILIEIAHERKYKTLKEMIRRKKTSILLSNPLTSFAYTESINKLASRILHRLHPDEKVLMVTSLLENEGKSTVAVNLALSFVKRGKKTLLIDGDLRKPACALILDQRSSVYSLADVLMENVDLATAVKRHRNTGLYVLSALKGLRTATNLVSSPKMKEVLKEASKNFDVIILDTPPMSLAPDAEIFSEAADASVLVVRQNEAQTDDLNDAIMILERSSSHLIGCVFNNVKGTSHLTPVFEGYGRYGYDGRYGKYGRYGAYGAQKKQKEDEA